LRALKVEHSECPEELSAITREFDELQRVQERESNANQSKIQGLEDELAKNNGLSDQVNIL
jgi:SMC interacting uncharacterized protein involved in chromosome segregation